MQSIIVQLDPIVCAAWRPTMSQGERGEGEGERVVEGEKKGEERGEEEGEEDREQRDNETFDSHNSQSFSSKSPLLAFCTGTGRLYFWSKKEGKKEGVIRWSDTMPPSSSTSFSTSLDTSIISTVTFGNKIDAGAVSTLKTMSTYNNYVYECLQIHFYFSMTIYFHFFFSPYFFFFNIFRISLSFLLISIFFDILSFVMIYMYYLIF